MSIPEEDLVALSEYLDGGLSEAEREAFEERLKVRVVTPADGTDDPCDHVVGV